MKNSIKEIISPMHECGAECHYVEQKVDELLALFNSNLKEQRALSFKDFKEFLADECFDLKKYKDGKYDKKIFNWFKPVTLEVKV